jgi:ABC-type multidrug transport system fused ATPase/permease subunit
MMPQSLYRYLWSASARLQLALCGMTGLIVPLTMAPLELQRRMVDQALGAANLRQLSAYAGVYLFVLVTQGGLKYLLNVTKGRVIEEVTRDLRRKVCERISSCGLGGRDRETERGAVVSIVAAEAEDVGGFAAEGLATPLLQGGTAIAVLGYLLWIEPLIAGFATVLYLPQALLVPWMQERLNSYARAHARLVRRLGDLIVRGRPDAGARIRQAIEGAYAARLAIYGRKYFLTFVGNFLDALGPLIVLFAGGLMVMQGRADVATLVVFISGFQKLSGPWDQLINFYRTAANARVKYRLIADALASPATLGGRLSAETAGLPVAPALEQAPGEGVDVAGPVARSLAQRAPAAGLKPPAGAGEGGIDRGC